MLDNINDDVVEKVQEEAPQNVISMDDSTLAATIEEPKIEMPKKETSKKESHKASKKNDTEKVALFSKKNLHIGSESLNQGFNIVRKDKADKWLKHSSVRLANPDEVASAYGK
jgi:hypothetical protein